MEQSDTPFEFSTVEGFFPTPVWVFDLPSERASVLNSRLRASLESMLMPLPDIAKGATWQTEQNLHEVPEFQELTALIQQGATSALQSLEVEQSDLAITACWANINPRGSAHKSHTHPNNYLSGVYYLKVPPGSGMISFNDPRSQTRIIVPRPVTHNSYNTLSQSLPVEEGRLVLFPAWLSHSVGPNPSEDVRISVSFNLMFTDFTERMSAPLWQGLKLKRPE